MREGTEKRRKEKKRKEEGIFKGFSFKRKFRDVKRGKLPKAPQPAGSSKAGQSFQHLPRADAFPILALPRPNTTSSTPRIAGVPGVSYLPGGRSPSPSHVRPNPELPFCTAHPTGWGALKASTSPPFAAQPQHLGRLRHTERDANARARTPKNETLLSRGWVPTAHHQSDAEMLQFGTRATVFPYRTIAEQPMSRLGFGL